MAKTLLARAFVFCSFLGLLLLLFAEVRASDDDPGFWGKEWYFSWGYNRDFWAPSDIHVSQPSLGNDFTVHNVQGVDYPQFDQIFSSNFTVPQFSLRIGHFLNKAQDLGIELSVDHTKYTTVSNQTANVTGTISGNPINTPEQLTSSYFNYMLHNGANHIMLNVVKRFPLLGPVNRNLSLSLLLKGGFGIVFPHADNTILGNQNNVGPKTLSNAIGGWWRLNGWTTGVEVALRFVVVKPVYIELADKIAYANLSGVPVYQGTASQSLWMNAVILSLGFMLNPKTGSL